MVAESPKNSGKIKMKVLIFEDETKGTTIRETVEARVKAYGGQSDRVRRVDEAISHLTREDVNLVVVHHYDFSDVDEMKKRFPKIKYAGYSGNFRIAREFGNDPKSFSGEFISKFSSHYDYVLDDMGRTLDEVLSEVSSKTGDK